MGFSCLGRIQHLMEVRVWCGAPAVQYGLGSEGFYNGGRVFVLGLSKGILD